MRDSDREVATTRDVAERAEQVSFVRHHSDGLWECVGGTDLADANAVAISMQELLDSDPSLREVFSLPAGWAAMRFDDMPWSLEPPEEFVCSSLPTTGFLVRMDRDADVPHVAGGEHEVDGAYCPNCDKPMLRMLSLDTTDGRLGLARLGVPFVHLLFCWTCNLAQSHTAYELLPSGGVQLQRHLAGGNAGDFPYADYPRHFSGAGVWLDPVPAQEVQVVAELKDGSRSATDLSTQQQHLSVPRHQVGGSPLFLQGAPAVLCPACATPMAFITCCADEAPDGARYTGNQFVQVVFMLCERDRIVSSYQECD